MHVDEQLGFIPGKKVRVHPMADQRFGGKEGVVKELHRPSPVQNPIEVAFEGGVSCSFRRDQLLFVDKADADAYAKLAVAPPAPSEEPKIKQVDFKAHARNETVLKRLEEVRERYDQGRVSMLAIVLVDPEGGIAHCCSSTQNWNLLIGGTARMLQHMINEAENGGPD